ncbi:hypothetical protein [Paenibacillus taichungensis]|jgi:hypothetical protein
MWKELLHSIAPGHYEHIKNDPGFPGVCCVSSHVLASYMREATGEKFQIVYGTFGANQLLHCWVEHGEGLIDLTLFQFFAYKQRKTFYTARNGVELLHYALEHQDSLVFEPDHPYRTLYRRFAEVEEEFGHLLVKGEAYADFLKRAYASKEYEHAAWAKSKSGNSTTFADIVDGMGYRFTKRFFTKWAIVPK